ncbi:hypothetical protein H5410_039166 [Solanum commersonii]|uniref:Uncharacterized protein n=1 Tax=Solanum commersonii TaxID=4109 RepID=A0A9J5YFY8_SOLCO|nr:hypothetical protein H5410_039166 [Solanum commersonii]
MGWAFMGWVGLTKKPKEKPECMNTAEESSLLPDLHRFVQFTKSENFAPNLNSGFLLVIFS